MKQLPSQETSAIAITDAVPQLSEVLAHARASATVTIAYYNLHPLDAHIDAAIAAAEASLQPAGPEAARKGVVFAAKVVGCRPPDRDVLAGYASILGELPADLLPRALRGGLARQVRHVLPTPGAFMEEVLPEWQERKARLDLLMRHRSRVQLVSRTQGSPGTLKLEGTTFRPPPTRLRRIDGE